MPHSIVLAEDTAAESSNQGAHLIFQSSADQSTAPFHGESHSPQSLSQQICLNDAEQTPRTLSSKPNRLNSKPTNLTDQVHAMRRPMLTQGRGRCAPCGLCRFRTFPKASQEDARASSELESLFKPGTHLPSSLLTRTHVAQRHTEICPGHSRPE